MNARPSSGAKRSSYRDDGCLDFRPSSGRISSAPNVRFLTTSAATRRRHTHFAKRSISTWRTAGSVGLDWTARFLVTRPSPRTSRFRENDALRRLFESVVQRCMAEGLVGAEAIANAACRHLCRRLRRCRRPPCLVLSDVLRQDTAVNALMGAAPPASAAWRSRWQCR